MFILATTEVHKIPITILSRCQRYDFRRITRNTIADRLRELSGREGIEAEEKALNYVAKAADGSMRDALSLYDQCIAFYFGQKLTYDMVLDVLGAVDIDIFQRLLDGILREDVTGIIELLEEIIIAGRELTQLITDFTWYLRNLLLLKTSAQADGLVDASTENMELLKKMAERCQEETLMRYIRILSELSNQLKYASQKRVLTEIALIKMCRPQMEGGGGKEAMLARISALEQRMENGVVLKEMPQKSAVESQPEKEKNLLPDAVPEELMAAAGQWRAVISQLKGGLKSMIGSARPSVGKDNQMLLVFEDSTAEGFVNTEEHRHEIEAAIEAVIQKKVQVATKLAAQGDSSSEFPDLRQLEQKIKMPIEIVD
jgi:DNA polymerase-3 subunit gamma/tau